MKIIFVSVSLSLNRQSSPPAAAGVVCCDASLKKTNILTRTIEGMFYIFTPNTSLPSLLPTVTFPRDMRKKEKFLKHITGEASLQTSAQSERVTDAFM